MCMHHVDVTFRFWADSLRSLLLDCHGTAIEASREARGEDTFPVFYTLYIKGKCQSHSLGKCPLIFRPKLLDMHDRNYY